jgi:hypothetical protein
MGSRARFSLTVLLAVALAAACAASRPAASTAPATSARQSVSVIERLPTAVPHSPADAINPELREELIAMMAEDQAVRTGIAPPGDARTAEELFRAAPTVDKANGDRMEAILGEFGWPGWSLVGEDGALAAWVLIQHADLRPELQDRGLALMRGAVAAGDADPGDLAYLIDRVLVRKDLPQLFGTQVGGGPNGEPVPKTPIEDPANVDARRSEVGLGTLLEYYAELEAEAEATPSAP